MVEVENGRQRPASPRRASPLIPPNSEKLYPLTHYVVVRADLPRGFLASQIVHAAGETSPGGLPEGTYAVVLAVDGIKSLLDVRAALAASRIPHKLICEPDAPWNNAPTCIGVVPTRDRKRVRKVLGRLPLLK